MIKHQNFNRESHKETYLINNKQEKAAVEVGQLYVSQSEIY